MQINLEKKGLETVVDAILWKNDIKKSQIKEENLLKKKKTKRT